MAQTTSDHKNSVPFGSGALAYPLRSAAWPVFSFLISQCVEAGGSMGNCVLFHLSKRDPDWAKL